MILLFLAFAILLCYAFLMVRYGWAWRKLPRINKATPAPPVFFTVLIPVRNEEKSILNVLQDLEKQTYPFSSFEVLVLDDHSTDNTAQLVAQYQQQSKLTIQVLFLASFPKKSQKKAALEIGIAAARGSWVACTDGDCRLPATWLSSLNQIRHQFAPKLISGPVLLSTSKNLFEELQALELSALIGVGAASIGLSKPTMCNGANIAYEKAAFYAVDGFAGNAHIASGDDEFLLHKVSKRFPNQIAFLKEKGAIVSTSPQADVTSFLQQRVRWASKWQHYESGASKLLAVLVLGANTVVFGAFLAAVFQVWAWSFFMGALALKLLPDLILLHSVLGFFGKKRLLSRVVILQVVYFPYVLFTAVLGLTGTYTWKGRQHATAS